MLSLSSIRKQKSEGFTIIEVLIVLAIAGLIMLIVFLAVPALQRNAHNTSAKNDVAGLLGAMTEYVNNNSGTLPAAQATLGSAGGTTAYVGGTQAQCTAAGSTLNCATAKVGYYDASKLSIVTAIPGAAPALGSVTIIEGATCNGNAPTVTGATARSLAAYYTLEGGAIQCQVS